MRRKVFALGTAVFRLIVWWSLETIPTNKHQSNCLCATLRMHPFSIFWGNLTVRMPMCCCCCSTCSGYTEMCVAALCISQQSAPCHSCVCVHSLFSVSQKSCVRSHAFLCVQCQKNWNKRLLLLFNVFKREPKPELRQCFRYMHCTQSN